MALPTDSRQRGLPVNPHILLPDGWIYKSDWRTGFSLEDMLFDLLDNQCFSAALHFAISHPSTPVSDSFRRPCAVSWLNLEVNPTLKNDVVAVVLPIVGWKRTSILHLCQDTSNRNISRENDSDNPCYVELHHCVQSWRLTQLLNLRVIVALPWPDLIPHFSGWSSCRGEGVFVDLNNYVKREVTVTILPNLFEEATRELLLTLLILTLKGYGRDVSSPLMNIIESDSNRLTVYPSPLASPLPPPLSPNLTRLTPGPIIQLPKRRPNITRTVSENRDSSSPHPALSTTAPPTSLTLASNHIERDFCQPSTWVLRWGPYGSALSCQKSLKEVMVGFLGLITESARQTALLLKNGFCMRVMYHQRHRLSNVDGIDFEPDMAKFLENCDVVILMDDFSERRASLSKALKSRSPLRQKSTKRSRFCLQEEDFRHFKRTGIFISTSTVENFSFSALAVALRNQTLSGAAFTIPLDGSLSSNELQSLYHMRNVIAVPPPSTAGFAPNSLRRQLAGLVLHSISNGLGLPFISCPELEPSSDLISTFTVSTPGRQKVKGLQSLAAGFRSAFHSRRSGKGSRQDKFKSVPVR